MLLHEILAEEQIGFPILSLLIFLPVVFAAFLSLIRNERLLRATALLGALVVLALSVVLVIRFIPETSDIQFSERRLWMPAVGSSYHVGVDGISILFIPLTAFVTVMALLFSWKRIKLFLRLYLVNLFLLEAVTIGIFCALDLLLFYVFWELALIPAYFLIKFWGIGTERQYAGQKYVLYLLVGSVPLLISIVLLGLNYHEMAVAQGLAESYSLDFVTLLQVPVDPEMQTLIFFLMAIGFAVKGPMLPFHTWMPTAVMEGPIGLSLFLVGLKLGGYGFIRFLIPLLPGAAKEWYVLMVVLGLMGILYGSLIALVQPNLRRLLAFAGVSHFGLVVVGLFSLNTQGLQGALIVLINLVIVATGLFFLTGCLYSRTGSSEISAFGGLTRHVPRLATFFFIMGLAFIGTPGTSGFHGEFLVMLGAFRANWQFAAVAVLGVVLSAGYFLWYFERAFFGPVTNKVVSKLQDLTPRELVVATSITGLIFWIGFYPATILHITRGSVEALAQRIQDAPVTTSARKAIQPTGPGLTRYGGLDTRADSGFVSPLSQTAIEDNSRSTER